MIVENGAPGDAGLLVCAGIVSSLDESSQGESAFNADVGLGSRKRIAAAASKALVSHRKSETRRQSGLGNAQPNSS